MMNGSTWAAILMERVLEVERNQVKRMIWDCREYMFRVGVVNLLFMTAVALFCNVEEIILMGDMLDKIQQIDAKEIEEEPWMGVSISDPKPRRRKKQENYTVKKDCTLKKAFEIFRRHKQHKQHTQHALGKGDVSHWGESVSKVFMAKVPLDKLTPTGLDVRVGE